MTSQDNYNLKNVLSLFLIGASVVVDVPIAGRFMGPDLLCLIGLGTMIMNGAPLASGRDIRLLGIMIAVWFFGAMVTDLIRATPAYDAFRGWSKIIVFATVIFYLDAKAGGRPEPIIAFVVGLNTGTVLRLFIYDVQYFEGDPWKFGYGPPITYLIILIISSRQFYGHFGAIGQVAATIAIALANLLGNFRSMFGLLIVAAAVTIVAAVLDRHRRGQRLGAVTFLALLAGGTICFQGVSVTYSYLVTEGYLGQEALEKYQEQQQLGLGLLLGGRVETLVSTRAIADSPIIGHGSWARDVRYTEMLIDEIDARGGTVPPVYFEDDGTPTDTIPSHSYFFGSWVEAGILGGVFWAYVAGVTLVALYATLHLQPRWRPLLAYTAMTMLWDILFSPFAADERFSAAAELVLLLWAIRYLARVPAQWRPSARPRLQGMR
jgi:hypothetical protein